jgi:hypothetical protein
VYICFFFLCNNHVNRTGEARRAREKAERVRGLAKRREMRRGRMRRMMKMRTIIIKIALEGLII